MDYVLPRGWQWVRLGGIAQVIRGVTFDRNDATDSASEDTIPILRAGNITGDLVTDRDLVWVPSRRVGREQLMQVGDVAICMSSGSADVVGKTAQLSAPWTGSVGAFCALIRPTSPVVDTDYFGHVFTSPVFTFWRRRQSMGANIQNLRLSDVESVMIPVPPVSEQRRIVEILNDARDIRRLRQQADRLTTQLIPAIFEEMFGDPIGKLPSSERTPLSEFVAEMKGGKSLGEDPSGTRHRVVKVSAVTWGQFQPDESKYVDDNYEPPEEHYVRKGDLLFSRANTVELVGATVLVERSYDDILLSDKIWRFVWKQPADVDPRYMLALFQHPSVRREISNNATGTGGSMKNISKGKLMSIRVILAEPAKQREFGTKVEEISSLYLDVTDDRKLAQSILAYAFSGELTANWRESHLVQLTQEATERDEWLRKNGVKLSIPDQRMHDHLDDNDGSLAELNREQRKLLEQIQNLDPNENGGTFTLSSLMSSLDEPLDSLTVDAVRRHLDVLAARGLIKAISRRAGAGGSVNVAFGNLYRQPRTENQIIGTADESDFQKLSELDRLSRQRQAILTGSGNITLPGAQMNASGTVNNSEGDD